MDTLRQDFRYACRALLNRPGFSVLAVLTLGIGIGVNTVAFSAINALLFKRLSFEGATELGSIATTGTGNPYNMTSLPDFQDFARDNRTLDEVFAEARMPFSMRAAGPNGSPDTGPAEQVWGLLVSVNYLSALRVRPLVGRLFTDTDVKQSELTAVVSERFWFDRLGGGTLAGRTATFNGQVFSIVGVVPDGFQGPGGLFEPDVWLPLEHSKVLQLSPALQDRKQGWLSVLGRLKPGVTPAQAQADLQSITARLTSTYPATNTGRSATFTPFADGVADLRRIARLAWIALGIVGIVLLIACFNVAGLLLARASARRREMAVRAALGASRGRILRQLVTEGILLAVLSGVASLVLAAWTADLLSTFSLPSPIPLRLHIRLDARLVTFVLVLVAIAGVLPALVPAFQATRINLLHSLKRESALDGRPSRTRNLFVVVQVAGATVFLAVALLFVRSFVNTAHFAPGFDTDHTLVLEMTPSTYGYDAARARAFMEPLLERISAVPGVRNAAIADRIPFYVGFPKVVDISATGENCASTKCRAATEYGVSPGYFAALAVPIRAGRDLTAEEYRSEAAVVVISETMANRLWPGANAVGQWLRTGKDGRPVLVIGIAADTKHQRMGEDSASYMYRPLRAREFGEALTVIVRSTGDPRMLIGAVQQQVQALDPALPVGRIQTMTTRMEMPLWPARTAAGFFLICGTLALLLATVGLFGVTYYAVSQRTREFGVRIALGATSRRVVALVVREGLMLSVPGVLLGIGGALIAMRVGARMLFEIGPADPLTYSMTAIVQLLVALAACALPAYRATKVDPIVALRQE
jgi:predicted permease